MFGIGISELVVIFLIALLVLGPDQLPKVARKLAQFMGEFRKFNDDLRLNLMSASNDITVKQEKEVELFLKNASNPSPEIIARGEVLDVNPLEQKNSKEGNELHG